MLVRNSLIKNISSNGNVQDSTSIELIQTNVSNEISNNSNSSDSMTNQQSKTDHNQIDSNNNFNHKIKHIDSLIKDEFKELRHAFEENDDLDDFHNKNERKNGQESVVIERQGGLTNKFVLLLLFLWYLFSGFTLYTNKYIVSNKIADPFLIGTLQMCLTSFCGFIHLKKTHWNTNKNDLIVKSTRHQTYKSITFWRNFFVIGLLRLFSIVLGLMALKQATVSFVETVKSSSPIFTVFISKFMIGEVTGLWTKFTLIPIMLGLALCSSFEINFSLFGFMSAILTNFTECLQNVFSKLLLCSDKYKLTPLEVQFFSSTASAIILMPMLIFMIDLGEQNYSFFSIILYLINGLSFHCQTLLAFTLMSYISPVTHSVCNTLKRALLIWFSVYIFHNEIGYISGFGTILVIVGVLLYIKAKNSEKLVISKINSNK
jgi:solute carrier family 35 protein E2